MQCLSDSDRFGGYCLSLTSHRIGALQYKDTRPGVAVAILNTSTCPRGWSKRGNVTREHCRRRHRVHMLGGSGAVRHYLSNKVFTRYTSYRYRLACSYVASNRRTHSIDIQGDEPSMSTSPLSFNTARTLSGSVPCCRTTFGQKYCVCGSILMDIGCPL